ncbi:B12-binding domain-containing radical SAM protein [Candidatus Woesearchaeota archaeon]|nr:B12-binding domain-containing radical SAM protein [Candidatus Woesearchaeota archaeon]
MKIALVLLPNWPRTTPSLGIAYLSSHLMKEGHDLSRFEFNLKVRNMRYKELIEQNEMDHGLIEMIKKNPHLLIDNKYLRYNQYINYCADKILSENPKMVGFSVFCSNKNISLLVAMRIKEEDSNIKVVFGGPDTFRDKAAVQYLRTGWIDYVITGEGEISFPMLAKSRSKKDIIDIPGIMYIDNDKVIHNDWEPQKDINQFEFPTFLKEDIKNSTGWWYHNTDPDSKLLPITTSRGCLRSCKYCTERLLWKCYRQRTPENVIEEIERNIKEYKVNNFRFDDCLINASIDFLKRFCNIILKKEIDINWGGLVTVDKRMDESLIKLMKKAGCNFLCFGGESGSDKILEDMGKPITSRDTKENIRNAKENDIWVHLYMLIGFPSETREDFKLTLNFIENNKSFINSIGLMAFWQDKNIDIKEIIERQVCGNYEGEIRHKEFIEYFGKDFYVASRLQKYAFLVNRDANQINLVD